MSDGFGTAFASDLVLEENNGDFAGWTTYPDHTEEEIDGLVEDYHGGAHLRQDDQLAI